MAYNDEYSLQQMRRMFGQGDDVNPDEVVREAEKAMVGMAPNDRTAMLANYDKFCEDSAERVNIYGRREPTSLRHASQRLTIRRRLAQLDADMKLAGK